MKVLEARVSQESAARANVDHEMSVELGHEMHAKDGILYVVNLDGDTWAFSDWCGKVDGMPAKVGRPRK